MEKPLRWQKSSFSDGTSGGDCLELAATWQKSSFSDGNPGGDCLELAATGHPHAHPEGIPHIHLRESDRPGTVLTTHPAALRALLAGLKAN
jgi:hypothetical protein